MELLIIQVGCNLRIRDITSLHSNYWRQVDTFWRENNRHLFVFYIHGQDRQSINIMKQGLLCGKENFLGMIKVLRWQYYMNYFRNSLKIWSNLN